MERFWDLIVFLLALLTVAALISGYFALQDSLRDFYFWNVTFNRQYASHSLAQRLQYLQGAGFKTMAEHLVLLAAGIPAAIWLIAKRPNRSSLLLGLLVPVSFAGVSMPGYYYPHYFIQMIAPLSIVSGIALSALRTDYRKGFHVIIAVIAVAAAIQWYRHDYDYYVKYSPDEVSEAKYGPVFVQSAEVAAYLKQRVKPGDYMFQWGFEPELYFLTGTRSPNRFMIWFFADSTDNPEKSYMELRQSLLLRKPGYIILQYGMDNITSFPVVRSVVAQYYEPETILHGFGIFRLKE